MKKTITLEQILARMPLEEVELYADIPAEVCREYVLEFYNYWKDSLTGENPNIQRNEDFPGISKLHEIAKVGNRTLRDMLELRQKAFGISAVDNICVEAPFTLNEITDRTREWAKENGVNWPFDYLGTKAKQRIIKYAK